MTETKTEGVERVRADFSDKLRKAELSARLERTPRVIQVDGADAPNPEWAKIKGAMDTGLSPGEYASLVAQGVEDVRKLVETYGVDGAKKMVRLDEAIADGERRHQRGY